MTALTGQLTYVILQDISNINVLCFYQFEKGINQFGLVAGKSIKGTGSDTQKLGRIFMCER